MNSEGEIRCSQLLCVICRMSDNMRLQRDRIRCNVLESNCNEIAWYCLRLQWDALKIIRLHISHEYFAQIFYTNILHDYFTHYFTQITLHWNQNIRCNVIAWDCNEIVMRWQWNCNEMQCYRLRLQWDCNEIAWDFNISSNF